MTRLVAAGTPGDTATAATEATVVRGSNTAVRYALVVPGQTFTVWSARTGGTRYTDLQLDADGSAMAAVTADGVGQVPAFRLPDAVLVDGVWLDPDPDGSTDRFFVPCRLGPATAAAMFGGSASNKTVAGVVTS